MPEPVAALRWVTSPGTISSGRADVSESCAKPSRFDQVQAEQTRALFHNCPIGVIGATIVAVTLATTLHGETAAATLQAYHWSALVGGCAIAHLILCWRYQKSGPAVSLWRRWNWAFTLIVAAEGATWC